MALCLHSSRFCFRGIIALQFVLFFPAKAVGEPLGWGLMLPISSIFTGREGGLSYGTEGERMKAITVELWLHRRLYLCRYWPYALMPAEISLCLVW